MMATMTATPIRLETACDYQDCADFAAPLYRQLSIGYETCSVLPIPGYLGDWRDQHRTARKRADRSYRLGYRFGPVEREHHQDDIYAINTSLLQRQGRPMTRAYRERQRFAPLPAYPCPLHQVIPYGVFTGSTLVAYLWLYRAGELALVSSILGHGDHLANDVMYLLMQGVIDEQARWGGYLVYNRHDSGTDGLRFYKERCGFLKTSVEWQP